ncbi:methionyl-tRNA formyltransferase [Rhizobiaceae bacterium]|nr:methionyl-tRNA formyltransferase [Rhizobiaceae bacterium]
MVMRVVFMGTPDFAVPTLQALHEAGHEIAAVYTQPPRPAGRRGLTLQPSPVHKAAEALRLEVRHPESLKGEDEQADFASLNADAAVVIAYGLLLPQAVLDATRQGCFNGHASLLPRWRGAAPIQRAIMAGDKETGVNIMQMEAGLDTGPVAMETRIPIRPDTTAGKLHDILSKAGANLMVKAMTALEDGELILTPQPDEGVTYASKIDKGETRIDWSRPAEDVHRHIMGLSPAPGAWCEIGGVRTKILASEVVAGRTTPGSVLGDTIIACAEGAVRLTQLQKAGGKPMDAKTFLRGTPLPDSLA